MAPEGARHVSSWVDHEFRRCYQVMEARVEESRDFYVHARAVSLGHEIVYALTDEPWGVRRFHVRDPNGVTLNVMSHLEEPRGPR